MVSTASRTKLVVLLYQGLLRFNQQAIQALERNDYFEAHTCLIRSQDIIVELTSSLDLDAGGELAHSLLQLYDYGYRQLVQANCKKNRDLAEEVSQIFGELLVCWNEIATSSTEQVALDRPSQTGGQ
jgi:flagellar protein FliS